MGQTSVHYHVDIVGHYYSVPCQHARAEVDVRVTCAMVEIFQRGQRNVSQALCAFKGRHTTITAHMLAVHREVASWNSDTLTMLAADVGRAARYKSNDCWARDGIPSKPMKFHGLAVAAAKCGVACVDATCVHALKPNRPVSYNVPRVTAAVQSISISQATAALAAFEQNSNSN